MWKVWDKKSDINGCSAEWVLGRHKHLLKQEIVFIKIVNGHVTNVVGKNDIAIVYGLNPTLPDEEFIAAYEAKLAEPDPDPETDTTTYAELAQVYKEGVNSIE